MWERSFYVDDMKARGRQKLYYLDPSCGPDGLDLVMEPGPTRNSAELEEQGSLSSLIHCLFSSSKSLGPSRSGFFNRDTVDILDWIILYCRSCPVHCRIFISMFSLYSLNSSSKDPTPPQPWVMTVENVTLYCPRSLRWARGGWGDRAQPPLV